MKKRAFLALVLAMTLCATVGQAALVQGGSSSQQGVMLTTAQPTQAPNVVQGLGLSGHNTQTTVTGSGQENAAPTEEPTAELTPMSDLADDSAELKPVITEAQLAEGVTYTVKGFAEFSVVIKLDENNNIVFVAVPAHRETPGIGAAVLENAEIFEALAGQYIGDAHLDTVSGATLTVNALNSALQMAAEECGAEWAGAAEAMDETEAAETEEAESAAPDGETKDTGHRL